MCSRPSTAIVTCADIVWRKYIDAPDPEFFDVVNDPEEKENRIAKARMDVSPWIKSIGKYKAVTGTTSSSRIPPEEAEKLRSLGYVGGEQKGSRIDPKSRIGAIQNFNEGLELLKKHEYANAEATFRKITTTEPQNGSAFHVLGDALAGQEKYEQAGGRFIVPIPYPSILTRDQSADEEALSACQI